MPKLVGRMAAKTGWNAGEMIAHVPRSGCNQRKKVDARPTVPARGLKTPNPRKGIKTQADGAQTAGAERGSENTQSP